MMIGEGRRELKYILPLSQRDRVLEIAADHIEADEHAGDLSRWLDPSLRTPGGGAPRGYRVNTLYLDTADLHTYTLRLAGAFLRDVVRIRTYGDPEDTGAPVFLENKRKLRDRVIKHRSLVCTAGEWAVAEPPLKPWESAIPAMSDGGKPGNLRRAQRWLEHTRRNDLRHVCTVHYIREVYIQGRSRLTIDHHVHAFGGQDPRFIQGPPGTRLLPEEALVFELKFNGRKPVWMRQICAELGLVEEPVSKYGLGVARTVRSHRGGELKAVTPPSIFRWGRAA